MSRQRPRTSPLARDDSPAALMAAGVPRSLPSPARRKVAAAGDARSSKVDAGPAKSASKPRSKPRV